MFLYCVEVEVEVDKDVNEREVKAKKYRKIHRKMNTFHSRGIFI